MEWLDALNKAMDYVEENLAGDIDYSRVARICCCSNFHFQRVFSCIANVSLSEYIRRRRMTAAAFELQNSDIKVLDIALKYGYESPTSFTRAFQNVHGIPPSAARAEGVKLKAYPRMSFLITIKGDVGMNYRIVKRDAFKVAGKALATSMADNQIPKFWKNCWNDGTVKKLIEMGNCKPLLGVCYNDENFYSEDKNATFNYMVGIEVDDNSDNGMDTIIVPESTWAIFESIGAMPNAIQNLWKLIMSEFLPNSIYKHAGTPDLEVYYEGDNSKDNYRSEVWMPVVEK